MNIGFCRPGNRLAKIVTDIDGVACTAYTLMYSIQKTRRDYHECCRPMWAEVIIAITSGKSNLMDADGAIFDLSLRPTLSSINDNISSCEARPREHGGTGT